MTLYHRELTRRPKKQKQPLNRIISSPLQFSQRLNETPDTEQRVSALPQPGCRVHLQSRPSEAPMALRLGPGL